MTAPTCKSAGAAAISRKLHQLLCCALRGFIWATLAVAPRVAPGQQGGTVDSSNIGIAIEDSVISSGLPTTNLESREFNVDAPAQQLMNTVEPVDYGGNGMAAAASQEYMVFKFDLSSLPAGAEAVTPGWFEFSSWVTLEEGTADEERYGAFDFYEITAGDSSWQDRYADAEGILNPNPVTFASLNGTFAKLLGVVEDNSGPPNNATENPFGALYPGRLVSNGGFDGANRVAGIPVDTINRLISGQSVGLAIGSVAPTLSPLDGDYNNDGAVNGADFLRWQRELGTEVVEGQDPDGSGNGLVDRADLSPWREAFGATSSPATFGTTNFSIHSSETFLGPASAPTLNFEWSAPALSSVPEPNACVGMLFWFACLARRKRPQRQL